MNGPTHQLIGVTVIGGAALLAGAPTETAGVLATGSYLASKLPDLDQRIWGLRHRCALTHGVFVAIPIITTLAGAGALASPYPLTTALIIGAAGGYLAHLAADACTVSGLTAWPLRDKTGRTRHAWLLPRPLRHNMTRGRRPVPSRRRPRHRRTPPRAQR
jgi:membrane-bound metal-dependent hydrolase YbcI (DUF457 family)